VYAVDDDGKQPSEITRDAVARQPVAFDRMAQLRVNI
jgi:hypothetical protein